MRSSGKISIIIVNWNGLHWLKGCLPTLSKQTYRNTEWILVDNASTDGSVEWTKKNYPKTRILVNRNNLGFSHANNIGYKEASGEYILFLNNDTKTTPTFLTELVHILESDPAIGGAQSKLLLMDDHSRLDSVGAFLTPTGFLYHYGFRQKDRPKYDKQIDLFTAKGACMMFKKEVLEKIEVDGWILDPDYFAYFEETDMCHRVWLAGYRVVYANKSVIYHKMGATSSSMNNAFVQYHSFKNRIRSYLKNLQTGQLISVVPLHILLCILLSAAYLAKGQVRVSTAILRAIAWNITNWPETMRMRKYIQKEIVKTGEPLFDSSIMRHPNLVYYWNLFSGRDLYE